MKEHNEIDQLFEQQLGNLSVEPTAVSWGEITSSLDAAVAVSGGSASIGRKKFYIYALIGTIAAVLAYVLFFNQGKSRNVPQQDHPVVEVKSQEIFTPERVVSEKETAPIHTTEQSTVTTPKHSTTNVSTKNTSLQRDKQQSSTNASSNHMGDKAIKQEISLDTKSNSVAPQNKQQVVEAVVAPAVYEAPVFVENKVDKQASEINVEAISTQVNENASESALTEPSVAAVSQATPKEEVVKPANIEAATEEQVEERIATVEENPVEEIAEASVMASSEEVIEKETTESKGVVEEIAEIEGDESEKNVSGITSPTETTGLHYATGWSVDVLGGPAFIQSSQEVASTEGQEIFQSDVQPEIVTPNIGLNVKYHINNWFIQSGVGYSEYGENKNYLQKIELHDTSGFAKQNVDDYYTYDTTGWIPDPNNSGVLIPVFDAVHHSDTSYSWITEDSLYFEHQEIYAQNRFRYIEIPAMVGYEFKFKNLGVEVATGVSVGFRVNSSGKFLDSENNLVDINPSNSPYSNTMMNYILTVGVKYHLSNRFSVIAQPIYKTNLNSLIKSGIGTDVRYSSFGVNIGVNYIIK